MAVRVGSLCSGYGGIEIALAAVLRDVELTWYAEYDAAPAAIMAHHHPGVTNHRDLTKIDWATLPAIDVMTAGFPCQPFSHAGKRKGANDERHLWPYIAEGIRVLRPHLVVLENVRGLLSAQGEPDTPEVERLDLRVQMLTSALERAKENPRARALAHRLTVRRRDALAALRRARRRLVRAIGAVLRDLALLGYDARWYGLRAADVGAAHGRFRVFIFATPAADAQRGRRDGRALDALWGPVIRAASPWRGEGAGRAQGLSLLPTPRTSDTNGAGAHGQGGPDLRTVVDLLPTPTTAPTTGNGHARSLGGEARLLPTPTATDALGSRNSSAWRSDPEHTANIGDTLTDFAWRVAGQHDPRMPAPEPLDGWGPYGAAVARWGLVVGRVAPDPTEPNGKGGRRLSPRFVEWLMGLPDGHVTDPALGITRNDQLKALGNGVVWQQAATALLTFIHDTREAAA